MKTTPARGYDAHVDKQAIERAIEQAERELETPPSKWARPVFVFVPLERIETRPELFAPQTPEVDEGHIEDIVARIAHGDAIDPPLVIKIGGRWVCVDGHKRIAAYRKLEPRRNIRCEWFDGSVREAADERLRTLRRLQPARSRFLDALRHRLQSIARVPLDVHASPAGAVEDDGALHDTVASDARDEDSSASSAFDIREELRYAPLANLRGRSESETAKVLVSQLADQYPRETAKKEDAKTKAYKQVKTRARFETAIAAFLAELLAAHGDEWRGGWIRCSLDKSNFKGEVTHSQFRNVREAWSAAGLIDEVKGYPGKFAFGNPGPGQGRMTRYKATAKLLAPCAEHGVTPDNVNDHFWIEYEMPSELVQLTSPSRQTPTNPRTTRLRKEVAELNEFINQQTITPSTIRHVGWVRLFHMADHPDFSWNKGGRLHSRPGIGKSNYQNKPESERLNIELNGEPVVEIDIGSSYLTIFYAWHDIQLDPTKDAYRDVLGPSELDRMVAKHWVNASFGNSSLVSKWTKELRDDLEKKIERKGLASHGFEPKDYPMKMIREKVLKRHPLLDRWGGEIRGRVRDWADLMFAESDAIIRTMLTLKREHGVPSLPVYDAIIVPASKVEVSQAVLSEQFRIATGSLPRLDVSSSWDF